MSLKRISLTALPLAVVVAGWAQNGEPADWIVTDRPDVTNLPYTIKAGQVQIESGIRLHAYRGNQYGDGDFWDLPGLAFRAGVIRGLELHAGLTRIEFTDEYFTWRNSFGFRAQLFREKGVRPAAAIQGDAGFYTEWWHYGTENWGGSLTLLFMNHFGDRFGLNYNVAFYYDADDLPTQFSVSGSFRHTQRLMYFLELYERLEGFQSGARWGWGMDGGVGYWVGPWCKADVNFGWTNIQGIQYVEGGSYFGGIGLAFRIDMKKSKPESVD